MNEWEDNRPRHQMPQAPLFHSSQSIRVRDHPTQEDAQANPTLPPKKRTQDQGIAPTRGQTFVGKMMADKYRESPRPLGWGKRRLMKNASTLYAGNYCDPSGIPIAATTTIPREKRMLRAVAGLIARAKGSGKSKSSTTTTTVAGAATTAAVTEPASSPTPTQLSRANSEGTDQGSDGSEENSSSKPRVSFSSDVSTMMIQQMTHEEIRKTFYRRSEYATFRDAYRVHRESHVDWCRSKDILPCNCETCRDSLPEKNSEQWRLPDTTLNGEEKTIHNSGTSDVADETGHGSKNPHDQEIENIQITPDMEGEAEMNFKPPSPAEVISKRGGKISRAQVPVLSTPSARQRREATMGRNYTPNSNRVSSKRRQSRGQWYGGSQTPRRSAPSGFSSPFQRHDSGLDDWGVNSRVKEAVRCHGEAYAYSTLRLQGFSDLYIRTHFLPDGGSGMN